MKKMLLKYLCFYMVIALIISVFFIYNFQTSSIETSRTAESEEKLLQVKERLKQNDKNIEQLTENISQSNLAKTRAFSQMILYNPSIINSVDTINKIAEMLMVDELHVTDENGILKYGNIPEYFNLDFNEGEQTKPFISILSDPSVEIVQEPQPNAAKGVIIQYVSVARKDKKGIVQVGMRPEILENILESTKIENVLDEINIGNDGYIFAIDKNSKNVLAAKNKNFIGKSFSEFGFSDEIFSKKMGTAFIDGSKVHFYTDSYEDMIIGTIISDDEYFKERNSGTIYVSISISVILILLIIVINSLVNRKIVRGIHNISIELKKIKNGNLDIQIKEYSNPEFKILSENINSMVLSIKENIQKNNSLMLEQKNTFDENVRIIENIRDISENINSDSKRTLDMADSVYSSSKNQEDSIVSLNKSLKTITEQLKINASVSSRVSGDINNVASNMLLSKTNMIELSESMKNIYEFSQKVESIISEVDSIASQTNMLSVNASIEASRAGEMGKGFAVVASQIGELAKRSTDAAKETFTIISDTISAVESGQEMANKVVSEFLEQVDCIEDSMESINKISDMTNSQFNDINSILSGLQDIEEIAKGNRLSAVESQNISSKLSKQAGILDSIVKNH